MPQVPQFGNVSIRSHLDMVCRTHEVICRNAIICTVKHRGRVRITLLVKRR